MAITHTYVSSVPDDGSDRVGSNEWNADHTIADATLTKAKLDATAQQFMVPVGGIILWSGAENAIPTGWHLCDGTSGTPNLQNKFIIGAGDTYAVGATAGSATHTHAGHAALAHAGTAVAAHANHKHELPFSVGQNAFRTTGDTHPFGSGTSQSMTRILSTTADTYTYSYSLTNVESVELAHTVTQPNNHAAQSHDTASNLPPYYALCYIMKLA